MATSTRRRWLRPPQLRTLDADQDERHATWLELFFDLVFVISIAEVVHALEDYRSLADFAGTAGLFVAVWWAWVGYTVYADGSFSSTDDIADVTYSGNRMVRGYYGYALLRNADVTWSGNVVDRTGSTLRMRR